MKLDNKSYGAVRKAALIAVTPMIVAFNAFPVSAENIRQSSVSITHPLSHGIEVKELKLSNGLSVWLNEDHSQPKVFGAVVVKAGSNDCPDTGIAHYFEHILFKGTDKIGTVDYDAEKPWLDSISAQYDLLARTTDMAQRANIQKHINELSVKASEYAIPNEFSSLITKYGGSGLNAATSYDFTYYYNTFVPQFIAQWCELNSERLVSPVFRLFQGELETVYEEKNMYSDAMLMPAMEKFMSTVYGGTPYEYPVIGSTANLKNPRLSEMREFYEKYYVAGNMGLILCGDIDADSIMPLLEKTFGRIKPGEAPQRPDYKPRPFDGKTTVGLKLPLPLVKAIGLCYRGPKSMEKDDITLSLAMELLSNDQETGLLDSLTDKRKWAGAAAMTMPMRDAGAVLVGAININPLKSKKQMEKLMLQQVERLKRGDFSEAALEHLKKEKLRNMLTNLENINGRADMMVSAFVEAGSWERFLAVEDELAKVTKGDVMAVVSKYFNGNNVRLVKKFGMSLKDRLTQPGYKAIEPKNAGAESDYAKALDSISVKPIDIRLVDFGHDVKTTKLGELVTLYAAPNTRNDIFTMNIKYRCGYIDNPLLDDAKDFINSLGTDSLSKTEFGKALQRIGTTIDQSVSYNTFTISLSGYDSQLENSLILLNHFMNRVKPDEKKLDDQKKEYKVALKAFDKSYDVIAMALGDWVKYRDESSFLKYSLSLDEVKNLTSGRLIDAYKGIQDYECDITYTGQVEDSKVANLLCKYLDINRATTRHKDTYREFRSVDKPMVYVYLAPQARQNIIGTYTRLPEADTFDDKALADVWGDYFGKGMSSLMFKEIREYRSFAYYAGGSVIIPKENGAPLAYVTSMGTQADKTLSALAVLDSLLSNMPVREKEIKITKQSYLNDINNSYPSFRGKANFVAEEMFKGYTHDINKDFAEGSRKVGVDDIRSYHEQNVKTANHAIYIVGNLSKADLEELKRYGEVRLMTKRDIIRM